MFSMESRKNLTLEEVYHLLPAPMSPGYKEAWKNYKALVALSKQQERQEFTEDFIKNGQEFPEPEVLRSANISAQSAAPIDKPIAPAQVSNVKKLSSTDPIGDEDVKSTRTSMLLWFLAVETIILFCITESNRRVSFFAIFVPFCFIYVFTIWRVGKIKTQTILSSKEIASAKASTFKEPLIKFDVEYVEGKGLTIGKKVGGVFMSNGNIYHPRAGGGYRK